MGRYTAGAVASIAYDVPVPAVDGNVLRVLSRVSGDDSDIGKQSVRTGMEQRLKVLMEQRAERLVPRTFNQALMELGALVCVPNGDPHCSECPWQTFCRAYIDIAEKCNINVEMIEGIHQGFGHGWIMTLENGTHGFSTKCPKDVFPTFSFDELENAHVSNELLF